METAANLVDAYRVRCIAGAESILRALPELADAASAWEQLAAVQELTHALSIPGRYPLLLWITAEHSPARVQGCIFAYSFARLLFRNRLISSADRFGRIAVFGPFAQRKALALAAARFLLDSGSALVRLNYLVDEPALQPEEAPLQTHVLEMPGVTCHGETWIVGSVGLFSDLSLMADFDETLSQLGRRTRRNIRDVMRKSVAELRCSFHSSASIDLHSFLELNRRSKIPVRRQVSRWRYQQSRAASGFLAGVQMGDGRWLCLAGGHISGSTVILEWQWNDLAFARYSPSLLMRAYLMQHFGEQGIQFLFLAGGSSHHMLRNFNKRLVHSLCAQRDTVWLTCLARFMRKVAPLRAFTRILFGHG